MKKLLTFLACMGVSASAATLKIAALAPEGTNWANTMKEFSKEVKKVTNGKVKDAYKSAYDTAIERLSDPDYYPPSAGTPAAKIISLHLINNGIENPLSIK